MMKYVFTAFAFLLLSLNSLAQDFTIVEKEGKKYYQHKVEAGHTLYAIAALYGSDEEVIRAYNEAVLTEGLRVGQTIYVPIDPDMKPGEITNPIRIENGFLVHRVLRRETLFSICKRYTVDINDVLELNPEANSGIRKDQELRIPANSINSVVSVSPPVNFEKPKWKTHQVLPGETLYSVSKKYDIKIKEILEINEGLPEGLKAGQIINLPLSLEDTDSGSNETITEVINSWKPRPRSDNPYKETYSIALALPFYADELLVEDLSSKEKRIQSVALNFYRGAYLAAEKLESKGLSMDLHVLNITNDKEKIKLLANEEGLHKMDLFIGPFQKESIAKVIEIAEGNNAHVVCPTPQSGKILLSNANVSKVTPSGSTMMGEAGAYLGSQDSNPNVILINTKWVKDKRNTQVFKKEYYRSLGDSTVMIQRKLIEINIEDLTATSLKAVLSNTRENVVVLPTEEKVSLGKLVNILPFIKYEALTLYLTDKWMDSDYIDGNIRNRFNVHIPSSFSNNYKSEKVLEFQNVYAEKYDDVLDEYSILGHDIMLYYGTGLLDYGMDFPFYFEEMSTEGLVDLLMDFRAVGPDSGFENHGVHMMYFDNFELKEELD